MHRLCSQSVRFVFLGRGNVAGHSVCCSEALRADGQQPYPPHACTGSASSGGARHLSGEHGRSQEGPHSVQSGVHSVLLSGSVFHEWVWLLISNISHLDGYREAVGACPPGTEGAGVALLPGLASCIFLSLPFLSSTHRSFSSTLGAFQFQSKSNPLPPWDKLQVLQPGRLAVLLIFLLVTFS